MKRVLIVVESLWLVTFWWQTRVDVSRFVPWLSGAPVMSDYVVPFVYLSDVLFGVVLVVYIVASCRLQVASAGRLKLDAWRSSAWVWFSIFLVIAAVSLAMNHVGWWGWMRWIRILEGGAVMWLVACRLTDGGVARRYGWWLTGGLVIPMVLLIGEWFRQGSWGLQWLGEWHFDVHTPGIAKIIVAGQEYLRPQATFAHPNLAAGILAIMLPWGMWLIVSSSKLQVVRIGRLIVGSRQLMTWLWMGLGGVALLVTFSRSAWVVAAVLGLWGSWPWWQDRWRVWGRASRSVNRWRLAGLLVLIGVIVGPLMVDRFMALRTTDMESIDRRVQLVTETMTMLKQQPWLGIGLNEFVPRLSDFGPLYGYGIWRQPVHNLLLLVGVETGGLGLVAFVGFLISLIWPLAARWFGHERTIEARLLIGGWVGLLGLGMIDHYWWTSQQGMMGFWVLCGATLAMSRRRVGNLD